MNGRRDLEVTRTVQFFRLYTEVVDGALVPFDNASLCAAIGQLAQNDDPYWDAGDGDVQVSAYLDNENDADRFAMAKIRRRTRPLTERNGVRGRLDLAPEYGLCEPIHVRLFENNIAGIEYNDDGPRAYRLRTFLQDKLPDQYGEFQMQPIFDRDMVARLARLEDITLFHFQVEPVALDLRIKERNFFRSLIEATEPTGMRTIEISMRVSEKGEAGDSDFVKPEIMSLLESAPGVQKLKVKGREDGRMQELDLLKERLVSKQHMMRLDETTSAIDAASAYAAIGHAYNAVRGRIPEIDFIQADP